MLHSNNSYQNSANGKLLITGEYLVLDGATALAVPLQFSQNMKINFVEGNSITWKAADSEGVWFEAKYKTKTLDIETSTNHETAKILQQILLNAQLLKQKPLFLQAAEVETFMNFNKNWGLGSSSTLISLIANYLGVNSHKLLQLSFGGSGYDVACAENNKPLFFKLIDNKPHVQQADFFPPFRQQIYFVYLGKKQNSREGIEHYKKNRNRLSNSILQQISTISHNLATTDSIFQFMEYMKIHEKIISEIIDIQPVKEKFFSDFNGEVKSLGAWGGDFVMAVSNSESSYISEYFKRKNYNIIFNYNNIVL